MRATSLLALYVSLWALALLLVLPFAARNSRDAADAHIPGQADSAPATFDVGRTFLRATILGTIMFALVLLNYRFGWITPAMLDVTGGAY